MKIGIFLMNEEIFMEMYEYTNKAKFNELPEESKRFVAKNIMREVQRIAQEKNIPEELAYEMYAKGLYDVNRVLQ
jgi:hypothetical protein